MKKFNRRNSVKRDLMQKTLLSVIVFSLFLFVFYVYDVYAIPNLVISELNLSDNKPFEEQEINIHARIQNKGIEPVLQFKVLFYLDGDKNKKITEKILGPLPGYEYGGDAEGDFFVSTGQGLSGFLNKTLSLKDPTYDLFEKNYILLNGSDYSDDCLQIDIQQWKNVHVAYVSKTKKSIRIYAFVYKGIDGSSGVFSAKVSIKGRKIVNSAVVDIPYIAQQVGPHTLFVLVDPDNVLRETNEKDNVSFIRFTVRGNQPPSVPVFFLPSAVLKGQLVEVKTTSIDPEKKQIKFIFNWGDGISLKTNYIQGDGNGKVSTRLLHQWDREGEFDVTIQAVDEVGKSALSKPVSIKIVENRWESKVIFQGKNIYNPTLGVDIYDNLYLVTTEYFKDARATLIEFSKSINEGERFFSDGSPGFGSDKSKFDVHIAVTPDGYKHGIFGYDNPFDIYSTYYYHTDKGQGVGISVPDQQFKNLMPDSNDANTWSYSCITPDIVSGKENMLAAVWIRSSDYPGGVVNDDNLCIGFNYDGWDAIKQKHIWHSWAKPQGKIPGVKPGDPLRDSRPGALTYSLPTKGGARYKNPSIAIDKNENLLIASFVANADCETKVVSGWGIQSYTIPYYFPRSWDTTAYPKEPIWSLTDLKVFRKKIDNHFTDTYPNTCVDKDNDYHIVFEYPEDKAGVSKEEFYVYHAISTDMGKSWKDHKGHKLDSSDYTYVCQGKWPDIAADPAGNEHIVEVKNILGSIVKKTVNRQEDATKSIRNNVTQYNDVYYYSPDGGEFLISTGRGKVNSKPRIVATMQYIHVAWSEQEGNEDKKENSIHYARLKLREFKIIQVSCTPNSELAVALLDVPDYDQNMPPFQNILPDRLWISFVVKNGFYRQHKINVEIFTDDGVTLVKRLVVDHPEPLNIDPSGGYLKQFVNYAMWDGQCDNPVWNGYVPPGFTWKIKITAQEIDDNGNPGKTTTNWSDWNGLDAGHRIIPESSLSMDPDGSRKGLRASYSDGTVIEGEGPINHGRSGLPSLGLDLSSYYQGFPGDWAGKWDINGIFREILNGYIYAPITGEYKFKLVVDDYGALVVNGWVICTYDNPEAPGEVFGNITLEGGKWYPIYMEYENRKGTNGFGLYWNIEVNQNFIFTDPTFIQSPQKDIKAFQEFIEGGTISGDDKKDNLI